MASVLNDATLHIYDVQLPMIASCIRFQQCGGNCVRCCTSAQPGHSSHGVHRIDQRLSGQGGNPALDMDRQRANCEKARGDRSAESARGRIAR
jgi:hypothetical protein